MNRSHDDSMLWTRSRSCARPGDPRAGAAAGADALGASASTVSAALVARAEGPGRMLEAPAACRCDAAAPAGTNAVGDAWGRAGALGRAAATPVTAREKAGMVGCGGWSLRASHARSGADRNMCGRSEARLAGGMEDGLNKLLGGLEQTEMTGREPRGAS